jgi:CRP/FNR family transcriptional regulator
MANLADHGNQVACAACVMSPLCNSRAVVNGAPSPVECRKRVPAGERLYGAGAQRESVYALRAGMAEIAIDEGHGRHVVRFLLPGDAPAYRAEVLGRYSETTCARLRALLSAQLADGQEHAAMLARLTAPQRVARFLLELSRRWAERGYSPTHFRLPMGRRAIGQHLALTTETVSRVLSDFQAKGWLDLPWREVRIIEIDKLREVLAGTAAAAVKA